MIDYEQFHRIKQLHEQEGLNALQISRELGLDSRTVQGWLSRERYRQRQQGGQSSILDPYKDEIIRMLERHPSYSAVQVLQRIQELSYGGGYNVVKRYVRKIRPRRTQAFLKLTFAPGECAQVDWGHHGPVAVGQTTRQLGFFVMALCFSRMLYVEFTVSQTMEHWLACHQHAFEFFGGLPARIMVDNLKSAVLRRAIGQGPVFNPRYLDFARHYGFDITACNVGKGNEKGIVERGVGYVKKNLLAGLEIKDFEHIQPACRAWLDGVANVRIHGETKKQPRELFDEEKARLRALPSTPYDLGTVTQVRVSPQFRVTLESNRYSVPARYAGESLTMKAYPDRICLYDHDTLVARHGRSYDRHRDFEDPDHVKPLLEYRHRARNQQALKRLLGLSPRAADYAKALEDKCLNPLHHIRRIVALSEIYGQEATSAAMDDAFAFHAFSADYIANILEQRTRCRQTTGVLHLSRRQDLLELDIQGPDMSIYATPTENMS